MRPVLAFLLLLGLASPSAPDGPRARVGVASSLEKLRPDDPIPGSRAISLRAARGECEAAQVAVRAVRRLAALGAEVERPAGLEVGLYRVASLRLARPSGPDGAAGEWPDPLVPVRDPAFGEARRAFPVAVPAGRLQSIWVEVCVPPDAPPGDHRGAVVVRDRGAPLARIPLRVHVWPFALPRTPTFVAAFGLSTRLGTRALGAPDDPAVARALAAAALRHRLTPFTLSADPPDGRCTAARCALDWTRLDAELAPVLDGTLVPGVKGGFVEVRIPAAVWAGPEKDLAATLRAWRDHFAARGWLDRLWLYTLDEPSPAQLPELARRARLARQAGIRVFATLAPHPALEGVVDAFAPNLTLLPDAPAPAGVRISYASCLSHGCAELPAGGRARAEMMRAFTGWPGYEIDRPAAAARAVAWLAARRGLSGELYYDMLQTWTRDPWSDPRAFAGNGDGTLLYPGRPAALGGRHPFPVESIRLKVIRDGLEDLELLRLARAAGLGALCDRTEAALVPTARGFARDPASWIAARRRLGDALAARLAAR
ncbi:MAG TPA: DUF4091 domain-containing protein [Anaeromyxobacter sp.]|nr:DUF4091 domain-containing protein [Anaeromyxobacter sp.]